MSLPTDFPSGEAALDYLFSSFEGRHRFHAGKRDREFRKPDILMGLARDLDALPNPQQTCLVTGSKGKGSVSRMIAWNLYKAGFCVGLVLTPEEFDHFDRIRIGHQSIPETDFCRILGALRPRLEAVLMSQAIDFYFAPSGLFLLIALIWFKEQGVDYWVIEGGRGVAFDEIGQLNAKVGVITNVMAEHVARLGPSIDDIAYDKLALTERCDNLVAGHSLKRWQASHHLTVPASRQADRPFWFDELNQIAHKAALRLLPDLEWHRFDTPAFFFARGGILNGKVTHGTVCCDAAIHADCIDADFLRKTGLSEGAVLIGLSDDKDGEGIVSRLNEAGFKHLYSVGLLSRAGHIDAWTAFGIRQIAEMDVIGDVQPGLKQSLLELADNHGSLYVIGVQVFIRSLRNALNIGVLKPETAEDVIL